jgi:hypothetical protein
MLNLFLKIAKIVDGLYNFALARTKAASRECESPQALIVKNGLVICGFPFIVSRRLRKIFTKPTIPRRGISRGKFIQQPRGDGNVLDSRQLHDLVDARQRGGENLRAARVSYIIRLSLAAKVKGFIVVDVS